MARERIPWREPSLGLLMQTSGVEDPCAVCLLQCISSMACRKKASGHTQASSEAFKGFISAQMSGTALLFTAKLDDISCRAESR